MLKIRFLIFVTAIMSSSILFAKEERTIEQKLTSLKLERLQAEVMIKKMGRSGRLNEKEVAYASRSIASIKEEDVKNIRAEVLESIDSANSLATK